MLTSVERAAATNATVLLEGQSGTGKELFARTLHAFSRRAAGPFVAINCAAIPENLLESELFGHEKGAFTGAVVRKLGKFEVAHGGTLFLDEIGDLPVALQPKILRVVETRSFERVGDTKLLKVDVRLVAATNQALRARVATGEFREDLFFRLSVFPIQIPPLRERSARRPAARALLHRAVLQGSQEADPDDLAGGRGPTDVPRLARKRAGAAELRRTRRHPLRRVRDPSGASRPWSRVRWPVPETDPWEAIDLSGSLADASRRVLAEVEQRKILQALRKAGSNTGQAADALRISYRALLVKMQEHGIQLGSRVGSNRRVG